MPKAWLLALAIVLCGFSAPARAADARAAEKRVVELTNAFREEQGLERQSPHEALQAAAREFARYMAETGRYGHAADGRQPAERAALHGYDYCLVLENIAFQYRSGGFEAPELAAALVEGWKGSPGHRDNMLEPAATQTGAGVARDGEGRYFAVQMFGRPKEQAIRFSLENRSGTEIEYRSAGRAFSLPPRVRRTHTVCRPEELSILLPAAQQPYSARPGDGTELRIVERQGRIDVVEERP
jgi:hypothetical protein